MKDLQFLKELIDKDSNGKHSLVDDQKKNQVNVIVNNITCQLLGETTSDLWNDYNEMCNVIGLLRSKSMTKIKKNGDGNIGLLILLSIVVNYFLLIY